MLENTISFCFGLCITWTVLRRLQEPKLSVWDYICCLVAWMGFPIYVLVSKTNMITVLQQLQQG